MALTDAALDAAKEHDLDGPQTCAILLELAALIAVEHNCSGDIFGMSALLAYSKAAIDTGELH